MSALISSTPRWPCLAARSGAAMLLVTAMTAGCSSSSTSSTGAAASLAIASGNLQSATVVTALANPLVVTVSDASGNPVSGATVTFTATGGSTLSSATATTNVSGQAQTTVTLGQTAGPDTVTASVNGVTSNAIFTMQANAAAAATVSIVSGNNQTATHGTLLAAPLIVLVHDQYGNAAANATVNWTTAAGTLGGASTTTDNTGMSQTTWTLPALAGVASATATLNGTSSTVTFNATGT